LIAAWSWSRPASAVDVTAKQAIKAAIDEKRRLHEKPELFEIVTGETPMTYQQLLKRTSHSSVFRTTKWKALLGSRTFWLVEFRIPENTTEIVGGGGSWVFVDSRDGTVVSIHHWK